MMSKILFMLCAAVCWMTLVATAQPIQQRLTSGTEAQAAYYRKQLPQIAVTDTQLEADIRAQLRKVDLNKMARTTAGSLQDSLDAVIYDVPVVFHIVHNYGPEDVPDSAIYALVQDMNRRFQKQNRDTVYIIPPYHGDIISSPPSHEPYIGKANIRFHLATRDTSGNPTHGITRNRSYLATNAGDEAKLDQWPPDRYINIWLVSNFAGQHAQSAGFAYATYPAVALANPYSDGIIGLSYYLSTADTTRQGGAFITTAEMARIFDVTSTFSQNSTPQTICGDDNVDDTPPTKGHLYPSGMALAAALADTICNWHQTQLGKPAITPAIFSNAGDTLTTEGIAFSTRTRIVIDTLTFYPAVDTAATFQPMPYRIVLSQYGNIVASYSDTVRHRYDTVVKVCVALKADPGAGYLLRFAQNPRARRDAAGGTYTRGFAGGINILSDSSANHKYNYFYNLHVDYGYYQIYANDSLVDYPDTANAQNYMDFTFDNHMFTYGQVRRMRATLHSSVAGRSNLISPANLAATGALLPWPKLAPAPDYYTYTQKSTIQNGFVCADGMTTLHFTNMTWNDTPTSVLWTFDHGAAPATSAGATGASVTFSTPGWVRVKLDATNSAGTNHLTDTTTVYAADPAPVSPNGYVQDFAADNSKWPIFNYFGGDHKWEVLDNVGYMDHSCISFRNYDTRQYAQPSNQTRSTSGLYADFYTPAFDLSSFGIMPCNLVFSSAGAYRTTNTAYMNDSLDISYSNNCGTSWTHITSLTHARIGNNGFQLSYFTPVSQAQWADHGVPVPFAARTAKTFFRFRYIVGSDNGGYSGLAWGTGNNFYLDRLFITSDPLGVPSIPGDAAITLSPNPTTGSATLLIKGSDNSNAQIRVTDVAGKLVFQTAIYLSGAVTRMIIPASALAVKGMYLVQAVTGDGAWTQKLVVY